MRKVLRYNAYLLLSTIIFLACKESDNEIPQNGIASVNWIHFERLYNDLDTTHFTEALEHLFTEYPDFSRLYFHQIMGLPEAASQLTEEALDILKDSSYQLLYHDILKEFTDMEDIMADFNSGLQNYRRLLSNNQGLPRVYSFISGFQYQSLVFEDAYGEALGIGLDLFMGDDFPYQTVDPGNPAFSKYLTRTFNEDHIIKKAVEVLVEDKMSAPTKADFLSLIIWGGKKLYAIDQILDFKPDTIIFEYTPAQMEWCRQNEVQMWNFFFDKDLFYETDIKSFNKLVAPAPYSPGMPVEAPGATGNYMGYRIVQEFMKRNPEVSLAELLTLDNAQEILEKSKFKPMD